MQPSLSRHPLGLAALAVAALAGVSRADGPPAPQQDALPPIIRSAASGPWSAPATWEGGKVPGAGARVLIRTAHRVVYDVQSDKAVRAVNIAGTLAFAPDRDTRLDVGLIK